MNNKNDPKISIIIPLYVISERFFRDFKKFENLKYSNFEIIVVCDKKVKLPELKKVKIRLLLTRQRSTGPAEKRDTALENIKSDLFAFIDDDAYPDPDWLSKAAKWFRNPDIVAVGGSGLTPPEDTYWQKIGGYIIESYLCSGGIQDRYYKPIRNGKSIPRFVDDWPAYNLIVRTSTLRKVGGYGSTFYGGEDTLLCLKLVKHGLIIADTDVIVYHHRREFPFQHLKQISGVGLHRGYFFMKYPETSRTALYLLPTFLTIGLFGGLLFSLYYWESLMIPFAILFLFIWTLGALSVYRHKVGLVPSAIAGLGIILTHIVYGIYFVKGLFTKSLTR